jgi:hypothetical protein
MGMAEGFNREQWDKVQSVMKGVASDFGKWEKADEKTRTSATIINNCHTEQTRRAVIKAAKLQRQSERAQKQALAEMEEKKLQGGWGMIVSNSHAATGTWGADGSDED